MEARLVAWGRAVKARRRRRGLDGPVLWLFTDARRVPDPVAVVAGLPRGLCGVVFRPEGVADPSALAAALGRACRAHRVALSVAGPPALAVGVAHRLRGRGLTAGLHLRGGRRSGRMPPGVPALTASAHGRAELVRARRAGAALVFLSPIFATASHPGARALGPVRWTALAWSAGVPVGALGGVDELTIENLPTLCAGIGGISIFTKSISVDTT